MARVTNTRTMSGTGLGPTVRKMEFFLQGLNEEAVIRVSYSNGDAREPGQWTLTASGDDLFQPKPSVSWGNTSPDGRPMETL